MHPSDPLTLLLDALILEMHGNYFSIPHDYLRRRDIKPLNPNMLWNIEPTIIAPCSSLIICLNFCINLKPRSLS